MPIGAGPWVGITGWGLANKRYNMSSYSEEVKPLFGHYQGGKAKGDEKMSLQRLLLPHKGKLKKLNFE